MKYYTENFSSAAFQPLYGQLADLWGRRYVMISVTAVFLLGSGLCGGSSTMTMLIISRAVQGIGAGGINMLIDMIICDLVPMRERGNFIGLLFLFVSLGSAIGPFIGGILTDRATWRWVFYINLPIGGVALAFLILFLQVQWKREATTMERLKRIDVFGNAILIASVFSILWALTYGGARYAWSDGNVAAPLVVGLVGLVLFFLYETSRWCPYPVMPPQHFQNRTTCVAFFVSFMNMVLAFWFIYFYPVYFQAVLGESPTQSGVNLIPEVVTFPIFAAVGGGLLSKIGRFKPVHLFACGLMVLVMGLSTILDQNTHTAVWAVFEVLAGIGLGAMISTTLQAVQAGLPETETAASTGTWSFIRSLGTIWGVSIPAAIFNNCFDQLNYQIDATVRGSFTNGQAYQHATAAFVNSFPPDIRAQVLEVYVYALRRVWQIGIVFAGAIFLAVFIEKEIPLRTELKTEFGLADEKKGSEAKSDNEMVPSNEVNEGQH